MEKVHISDTFMPITFFFVKTFSTDFKSAWNSAFFDNFFDFFKEKTFLGHISTFLQILKPDAQKRLKKRKNFFYKHVLEFSYAAIKG